MGHVEPLPHLPATGRCRVGVIPMCVGRGGALARGGQVRPAQAKRCGNALAEVARVFSGG